MPMPKLSNVPCVNGSRVSPDGAVTTNDLSSLTDSLLYCPAGNNQVLTAAIMMTSIKMLMGLGKELLLDIE